MYKETAEYAFDLLEYNYQLSKPKIDKIGYELIEVCVPQDIYELLKCKDRKTGEIYYPKQFRKIDIVPLKGIDSVTFRIKE